MMPSSKLAATLLFASLVALGFLTRAATAKSPLLDHHSWRQADTAAIARNFYREDFNILHPQVDWRGSSPTGYVATGLELHAYLVAGLAFLIGFRTTHGRWLSCLWFIASATMVHRFLRERYGIATALTGTAAYIFGFPLVMYMDRTFMNEPLLLMLTFVACRAAQRHIATNSWTSYMALGIATMLLGLIKAPYLIVWAGVLGLFVERYGARTVRLWKLHAMLAMNLVAVLLWYSHAQALAAQSGLSFGLSDKLYVSDVVVSFKFWSTMVERLGWDVFGPIGLIALGWGAVTTVKAGRRFEPAALLGAGAYLVLVAQGNAVHDYYQLAMVPIGAVLVAVGLYGAAEKVGGDSTDRRVLVLTIAVLLMTFTTFMRTYNSWYGFAWEKSQVCAEGTRQTTPADRLIVLGDRNPELMFCLDRRGWIPGDTVDPARLEQLRASGGTIILVSREFDNAAVRGWLAMRARPLVRNARYTLFRVN
jgi:hypothetical protein